MPSPPTARFTMTIVSSLAVGEGAGHILARRHVDVGQRAPVRAGGRRPAASPPARSRLRSYAPGTRLPKLRCAVPFTVVRLKLPSALLANGKARIAARGVLHHRQAAPLHVREGAGHVLARIHRHVGRVAAVRAGRTRQVPARRHDLAQVVDARQPGWRRLAAPSRSPSSG